MNNSYKFIFSFFSKSSVDFKSSTVKSCDTVSDASMLKSHQQFSEASNPLPENKPTLYIMKPSSTLVKSVHGCSIFLQGKQSRLNKAKAGIFALCIFLFALLPGAKTVAQTCPDPVVIFAGADVHLCESGDVMLSGFIDGPVNTGEWVGGLGTFLPSRYDLNPTYIPDPSEAGTTFPIILKSALPGNGCARGYDTIMVTVDQLIDVFVGADINLCVNGSAMLSGFVGGGVSSGHWEGGLGSFSSIYDMNAEYFPSAAEAGTQVSLTLVADNGSNVCPPASASMNLTVNAIPLVDAGSDVSVCYPGQTTLAGAVTVGATQGHWTGGAGTFIPNRNTLNAVYQPAASEAGTDVELWLVSDNNASVCTMDSDYVTITVVQSVVNAGPDNHICADGSVYLSGFVDGLVTTGHWTGGLGTFVPDRNNLSAEYIPNPDEDGTTVVLTLELDATSTCYAVSDASSLLLIPSR